MTRARAWTRARSKVGINILIRPGSGIRVRVQVRLGVRLRVRTRIKGVMGKDVGVVGIMGVRDVCGRDSGAGGGVLGGFLGGLMDTKKVDTRRVNSHGQPTCLRASAL